MSEAAAKPVYRVPFVERTGTLVATGRVTVKLLSHVWPGGD